MTTTEQQGSAPTRIWLVDETREGLILSWARDTYSFGILLFASWFVNTMIPPSGWFNALVAALWFFWMIGKGARHNRKMTAAELRAYLDEHHAPTPGESRRAGVGGVSGS